MDTVNPITGEVLPINSDESLVLATKKQVFRLLKPHDFVEINGLWEAKRDGLLKILSSLPVSYKWHLVDTEVTTTEAKVEGVLIVEIGNLKRESSGIGMCERTELRGNGGMHFMLTRAETRALKRAIEVLFGSVINFYVLQTFPRAA